jgi:hypothetical protein
MAKGRTMAKSKPTSLFDHVIAAEKKRHATRSSEIKRMSAKLLHFEPTWAALEARDIGIVYQQIYTNHQGRLDISCGGSIERDHSLFDAMLELGFKEVDRTVASTFSYPVLKKDRVLVSIMVRTGYGLPEPTSPPVQTSAPQTPEA